MKKRIIGILIILVCLGVIFAFTNKSHTFTGTLTRNGTEEKASATLQYKRYMDWFSQGNKKIKGTLTINLSGGESVIVHELETTLLQPGTMEFRFGSYYAYDRERNEFVIWNLYMNEDIKGCRIICEEAGVEFFAGNEEFLKTIEEFHD